MRGGSQQLTNYIAGEERFKPLLFDAASFIEQY